MTGPYAFVPEDAYALLTPATPRAIGAVRRDIADYLQNVVDIKRRAAEGGYELYNIIDIDPDDNEPTWRLRQAVVTSRAVAVITPALAHLCDPGKIAPLCEVIELDGSR